ncbi:hypothetical protein [Prescottella sp. R16]|uniref:hypothetical protein n=1 Tax=Prescottella sp. R16 TaxID=3064529 RepID=UPI00272E28CB|nr:hypothetical protein [Prescottella sp. R16]
MKRGVVEIVAVAAAVVLAVMCWRQGTTTAEFGPLLPGAPSYTVTQYSGSWIGAAFGAVLVAGLLALDAGRRLAPSRKVPVGGIMGS